MRNRGFSNITVTPESGDQGIDIVAYKAGMKYGVQCKYYTGTVGNKAVQEAYAGAAYYGCAIAMVITNSVLSKPASALAKELNVEIWEHIDAIYLQKHSKKETTDYTALTQAEKDDLRLKEIEAYLQEKYRAFHLKYPADINKDTEIARYADRMERQADSLESSFQRELAFSKIRYMTVRMRNWRDPALTPIKNDMRKCTKEFGGQLKRTMDEANQDAEHYLSTKISINSIIKLSDMIAHIFHMGDGIRVTFNESTSGETRDIAQFTWPEKYFRIAHKWKTIKKELPSDPEEDDTRKERVEREFLQGKLNKMTEKLREKKESVRKAQEYIQSAPNDLEKKKSKDVFIIWDVKRRRDIGGVGGYTVDLGIGWDTTIMGPDVFWPHYKELGRHNSGIYEKIYVVGLSNFDLFFQNCDTYMQLNALDDDFPHSSPKAVEEEMSVHWKTKSERKNILQHNINETNNSGQMCWRLAGLLAHVSYQAVPRMPHGFSHHQQ